VARRRAFGRGGRGWRYDCITSVTGLFCVGWKLPLGADIAAKVPEEWPGQGDSAIIESE